MKQPKTAVSCDFFVVEHSGIEPLTATLPVWRSPFHDFLNLENEGQAGNGSVDMLSALWKLTAI